MAIVVVAALSARLLAEAAVRDGHEVIALDLFGDTDTLRAARRWERIGDAAACRIDADRLLAALQAVVDEGRPVVGWIAGSGFDGRPKLLAAGSALLPLLGTPPEAVRRVRDPDLFFGVLAAHGIGHPPVRRDRPGAPAGWLEKDARASGGWHIRHAADGVGAPGAGRYFQRAMAGVPMSATFVADGRRARIVGCNELLVQPFGTHPYVYRGCIGPLEPGAAVRGRLEDAVAALTAAFGLRGWCSLDVVRDGDAIGVLEANPRPPASLALYQEQRVVDAQLAACLDGALPAAAAGPPAIVRGTEIVFARRAGRLDAAAVDRLAARSGVHDVPVAGTHVGVGDPVCSLSFAGPDAESVRKELAARRDALYPLLETTP